MIIQKTSHSVFGVRTALDLTPVYGGTTMHAAGGSAEEGVFGKSAPRPANGKDASIAKGETLRLPGTTGIDWILMDFSASKPDSSTNNPS